MKLTRENAILPFPTDPAPENPQDFNGLLVGLHNGYLTEYQHGSAAAPLGACVHFSTSGEPASVALMSGGLGGTVKLKLDGTVAVGDYLCATDGGKVYTDPGTGARTQVAQALEAGVSGEMVECILFKPIVLA